MLKLDEFVVQVLVNLADRCHISAPVAVVRRAEDRHNCAVVGPIVPLRHQLVRPGQELQAVLMFEGFGDVLAKCVPRPPGGDPPAPPLVRVTPEEVAHGTLVGDLLEAVDSVDVVDALQVRRQACVGAENLPVDQPRQWEIVEQVREVLPDP